tara:strand:- start:155 stop:619 length:465 start_codon:yes stop_codon:yes gene_type:complete
MSGYTREFLSIEQALKEVVRKIDKEDIKNATGKSESFFRKCSDENDIEHNLHLKDAVQLDCISLQKGNGTPLLSCMEALIERCKSKTSEYDNITSSLLNIGGRIGSLMEKIKDYTHIHSEGGIRLTKREKDEIYKSIASLEEKIITLKMAVDND